ncbi:MAG: N-carbamoylputrescine amidase [Eubacterium sp.]|nr:N-carbamoylputrescine amidase [Eubacterium sp.]
MKKLTVGVIQMACCEEREENIDKASQLVYSAAEQGANVILLPELFETPYFCQQRNYDFYYMAERVEDNPAIKRFREIARQTGTVIPVSFYEKSGNAAFNSVAVIDADGSLLGIYRKSHIPDDHFYQEKFYFSPGDTGFKVWDTKFGKIGVGICWDQWFPEAARIMALMGAELLLYPTAIGSEPILDCDSMPHWRRAMQGHAAANLVPVAAANRIGTEYVSPSEENQRQSSSLTFYGSSFITDATGKIISSADRISEQVILADLNPDDDRELRQSWGVFRDRRPDLYKRLLEY